MLKKLLAKSLKTAVDFKFIKQVVGKAAKIAMIDYESFTETTTLEKLFRGRDGVAILFHIKDPNTGKITPIGHWCLLLKATKKNKNRIQFFDSLGLGLRKILALTNESHFLLDMLKNSKWADSKVKLQTQGKDFRECGSFVAVRAVFKDLTNTQFARLIGRSADNTVVMMTLLHYVDYYDIL